MDRLKNTLRAAAAIGIGAATVFVALVFAGGILAIAGVVVAVLILVGGIYALFRKKPLMSGEPPLEVVFTRIDEADMDRDRRRR